jgi:DNA polymerase epsilon subunit 2
MDTRRGITKDIVVKATNLANIIIRPNAIDSILQFISNDELPLQRLEKIIQALTSRIENKQDSKGIYVVEKSDVDAVVDESNVEIAIKESEMKKMISSFATPKFVFDPVRKMYVHKKSTFPLAANADARIYGMFLERLVLIQARLLRNPIFSPPPLASLHRSYMAIIPLDQLATHVQSKNTAQSTNQWILLGILSQPEPGIYTIEDSNKSLVLSIDKSTQITAGMFTPGCIVMVQGTYRPDEEISTLSSKSAIDNSDQGGNLTLLERKFGSLHESRLPGLFHVQTLGHPPAELRETTLKAMSILDSSSVSLKHAELEYIVHQSKLPENRDDSIVFISNVHLDKLSVRENLRIMLEEYVNSSNVPKVFVLMGNFCSHPFGHESGDSTLYKELFTALGDLIASVNGVGNNFDTSFVLIPGPSDPSATKVLPRHSMPTTLLGNLLSRKDIAPKIVLMTNPCRMKWFDKEIVIFRSDITDRLTKHMLLPLSKSQGVLEPHQHAVRTVIDQGHLLPLELSVAPIYWEYDHALRISPLPDVIVLAEANQAPYLEVRSFETRVGSVEGDVEDESKVTSWKCSVVNPGDFVHKGNWAAYQPNGKKKKIQLHNLA